MTLIWPEMLWMMLALPVLIMGYVILLRRRSRTALRYASLSLVRGAIGPGQRLRRHIPPLLLLLALGAAIAAMTRPTTLITLPSGQRTVVLAIDVSLSMAAPDIAPNRLAAAQAAARDFIRAQPPDIRIGIVSFAGTASLVQAPTLDREDAIAAVDRFRLDRHTAIGSGIVVSLGAIFPEDGFELEAMLFGPGFMNDGDDRLRREPSPRERQAAGSNTSSIVILLTDGSTTSGPDPLDAARLAADRGIRVYTVGFGSEDGSMVTAAGWSFYSRFDEASLQAIADITGAAYFHADDASALEEVYENLSARFVLDTQETEITALLAACAVVLMFAAAALSLLWFGLAASPARPVARADARTPGGR